MQIVIDIPKEQYNMILMSDKTAMAECASKEAMLYAIKNGIPLPKGHGRLIDEKEINTVVNGVFNGFDKQSPKIFLNVIHNQCIEAVGADRSESEE